MEETTVGHGRFNHQEEDEKDEQPEPSLHSNPSFDKQEDNQPSDIHEEGHIYLAYEECNEHIDNYVNDIYKEYFIIPIYNECEDGLLDDAPKEPAVCNHGLDHLEEIEGPKWDLSSCFSNS